VPAKLRAGSGGARGRVETRRLSELPPDGTLEAHGLMLVPSREFCTGDAPHWLSFVPPNPKGAPHPFTAKLTKRQVALHALILQATARHLKIQRRASGTRRVRPWGIARRAWPHQVHASSPRLRHWCIVRG
jgi:hypothetical protein